MTHPELQILLVDDDEDVLKVYRLVLEHLDYQVTTANSGQEALNLFHLQPSLFDLVISDINMPNMDGIALVKEIVAIRPDIPIILCTGNMSLSEEQMKNARCLAELVMKPFTINKIKTAVEGVFKKYNYFE